MLVQDPEGGYRRPIAARPFERQKQTLTPDSSATGSVISVSSELSDDDVQEVPYAPMLPLSLSQTSDCVS